MRFRDQTIAFKNGANGHNFEIPTANPLNYFHVISRSAELPKLTIDGKLFLPPTIAERLPQDGRRHGRAWQPRGRGLAPRTCRDDHQSRRRRLRDRPFWPRGVLDGGRPDPVLVRRERLRRARRLAADVVPPEINSSRVGAQGHSRGGSAVLTAAMRRFADAVVGAGAGLRASMPPIPGAATSSSIRPSMKPKSASSWAMPMMVLAMQVQGHCQAIRLSGGRATMRLIGGAQHSFDRGTEIEDIPDASVFPGAPTAYIANDGAYIHPLTGVADSMLVDRDLIDLWAEGRLRPQGRQDRQPRWRC